MKAAELFGSPENAVEIDGAHFRAEHAGWQEVLHHGLSSGVLHEEAWGLFKQLKISSKLKKRLISEAIGARQHLIIPDTANDVRARCPPSPCPRGPSRARPLPRARRPLA